MTMAEDGKYHVVFEYNENAKPGYRGCRFRVTYENKEEFDNSRAQQNESNRITNVVEEGVSDERSLALCEAVSPMRLVASAFQEATGPDGKIDSFILQMELGNVNFALADRLIKQR